MAVLNDTWYTVRSTEGTNFWMTFMPNAGSKLEDRSMSLQLHATTRYDEAKVTVTLASKTYTFTVQKGKMHTFTIPESYKSDAYILEEQRTDQMRGVHVTSNYPISLYASNYGPSSYDATMVLPTSTLGQEYVIQTFSKDRNATEFAIVAKTGCVILNIIISVKVRIDFGNIKLLTKFFCKKNYWAKNVKILRFSPELRLSN